MSGGINMDEEKRRLQYMQFRAEQKLESEQNMDFKQDLPKVRQPRDILLTIGIVAALILVVFLLSQSGLL